MKTKLEQFLNVLFDPDEFVWFGNCYKSNKLAKSQSELMYLDQSRPSEDGYFVCLNPADNLGLKHGRESISKYRNILIECDDMSLSQQESFLHRKKLPFSTLTYSGGKSLHAVISMEKPFQSEEEYKRMHDRITFALCELNDAQTNKVSIFTRLPEFLRQTEQGIRKQANIESRPRISLEELEAFLRSTNKEYYESKAIIECAKSATRDSYFTDDDESNSKRSKSTHQILETYVDRHEHKRTGSDQYQLRCPICAERGGDRQSNHLSINSSKGLWNCYFGCDGRELFKAIKKKVKNI